MKFCSFIFLFINLTILTSCSSTKNISGTYNSNFADLGFFATRLKLKPDSTFEYRYRGDMVFDTATGHYSIANNKVILVYDIVPAEKIDLSRNNNHTSHIYYIGHNKLFESYRDGKIVRRTRKYNKRKKFILFGSHYYKRKWYLKRID